MRWQVEQLLCRVPAASRSCTSLLPDVSCTAGAQRDTCMPQDTRLNYVAQHAQRAGIDEERLEDLRVSASKASPLGDALDLCVRYTDADSLPQLVPALAALIR